jgi:hypothetical protein
MWVAGKVAAQAQEAMSAGTLVHLKGAHTGSAATLSVKLAALACDADTHLLCLGHARARVSVCAGAVKPAEREFTPFGRPDLPCTWENAQPLTIAWGGHAAAASDAAAAADDEGVDGASNGDADSSSSSSSLLPRYRTVKNLKQEDWVGNARAGGIIKK